MVLLAALAFTGQPKTAKMAFIQPKTFIIVAAVKIIAPPPRIFFSLEKHTLNKWHYVYDYNIAKEVYKVLMLMKDIPNAIFIKQHCFQKKQNKLVY